MAWLQLILNSSAEQAESLSAALTEWGAVSVTLQDAADQPIYEPALNTTPVWQATEVVGLFEQRDSDALKQQVTDWFAPHPVPPYRIETLEEQDWTRAWMADFQPMQFGERVWVCPSWTPPPVVDAVNILLDPGLAFGTGTHATTALCLQWLDQYGDLSGKTVIDYGCGSGILAIAAAKLGATQVIAVDNDPQALLATQDNATHNHVADVITPYLPKDMPHTQVDVLLANILANPLMQLTQTFTTLLKPAAPVVLSGILAEQTDDIKTTYQTAFDIKEVVELNGWMRVVATLKKVVE